MTILGNTLCELLWGYQERKPGCCTKVEGINPLRGVKNSLGILYIDKIYRINVSDWYS